MGRYIPSLKDSPTAHSMAVDVFRKAQEYAAQAESFLDAPDNVGNADLTRSIAYSNLANYYLHLSDIYQSGT